MTVSVCTIARGRDGHLVNLVLGLARQTLPPAELVIAVMQDEAYVLPEVDFPVRQLMIGADAMPLAGARNAAARSAAHDALVFLDVDCIPDAECLADYARLLPAEPMLLMGEVLYLPKGATDAGIDDARFRAVGVLHAERAGPPAGDLGICTDYRCFWSLNFAIRRTTFETVGGFDESYVGYGGEDTDFGRMIAEAGVPIRWCRGARAYHQYHPHHMPPVHHVDSVIANAARFADKWGHYTMEHWLRAFTLMGLVREEGGRFVRLRDVSEADLAITRKGEGAPYASSATVLALLEREAATAAA